MRKVIVKQNNFNLLNGWHMKFVLRHILELKMIVMTLWYILSFLKCLAGCNDVIFAPKLYKYNSFYLLVLYDNFSICQSVIFRNFYFCCCLDWNGKLRVIFINSQGIFCVLEQFVSNSNMASLGNIWSQRPKNYTNFRCEHWKHGKVHEGRSDKRMLNCMQSTTQIHE